MTPPELIAEMLRLSGLLDEANTALRDRARKTAEAEREYRKARADAWQGLEGTAKEREDLVNGMTAGLRHDRDRCEGDVRAAQEAVRNLRTQLSMCQTISGLERELAAFGRTGPEMAGAA